MVYSIKGRDCGANTGRKMIKLFIKNYSLATNNPSILIKLYYKPTAFTASLWVNNLSTAKICFLF
ncbi:hypothetical protein, partial [Bacillus mycoides]|uniref:hypothetical protein n=1 Tax=Bacillus mycoides TaxID=1405 RepID=UPI003D64F4F4